MSLIGAVGRVKFLPQLFSQSSRVCIRSWFTMSTSYLDLGDGRKMAYNLTPGDTTKFPTVVFVPGFMSNMEGLKAKSLEKYCSERNVEFIRFDYEAVGESPGSFDTVFFKHWRENCESVVERLVKNRAILVGSSMGGWISLKATEKYPSKICGLVLIAPALNFMWRSYQRFYQKAPADVQQLLESGSTVCFLWNDMEIHFRKSFAEESRQHEFDLTKKFEINCPVHILQGMKDTDVPYKSSLAIVDSIEGADVDYTLRKDGDHRLSEPDDIDLILNTLEQLMLKKGVCGSKL